MANSAPTATSSLVAAPTPRGIRAASGSGRFGAAPANAFASLLDQLGQPLAAPTATIASTATAAPTGDAFSAAKPTANDQPSPPTALVAPTAPPPTAAARDDADAKTSVDACHDPKSAIKRVKTDDEASDTDSLTPASTLKPELPSTAGLTMTPAPSPVGQTTTSANGSAFAQTAGSVSPSPADAMSPSLSVPPSATAPPASTPAKDSPASDPSSTTGLSSSSRMAGRAAAATQAGLSVEDGREESEVSPEPQIGPQRATATPNPAAQNPPAAPVPPTVPQLASAAVPPPTVVPATFSRGGGPALATTRAVDADAPPPSSSLSTVAASESPPLLPVAETQAVTQPPNPSASAFAAAVTTASTRPAQDAPPPPPPATQVAQAIVEPVKVVLTSPTQAGPATPHVTTIQITPVELGRVEVRIERVNDGPAKIQLIAERPETLTRLVHDQSQLQQALDHAGIPHSSRTIEFSLAPATTDAGASSTSLFGNNTSSGESSSNGFQRQNNAYYNQKSNEPDANLPSPNQSYTVRTGIDITA